ncbi:MAG: energy-coupling factor transporter ATPase [Bacillota bacterium]
MIPLIKTVNLSYTYRAGSGREVQALRKVNMQVNQGEIVAITGQNGSGKSTLARHFNGLLKPDQGEVLINGLSTANNENIPDIRKIVGMVFQNPDNQLVSSIVEEDIAFGPENLGLPPGIIKERVDHALSTLNLEHLRQESPGQLSEGQKQLVAIAGVLAMRPKCIVLDEPTAHLDPRSRREVIDNIKRLNREEDITIILLTHYMNEVIYCERMIVMDQGLIVMEGTPKKIFNQDNRILDYGLDYPVATRLARNLKMHGIKLSGNIIHPREIVESICRLK